MPLPNRPAALTGRPLRAAPHSGPCGAGARGPAPGQAFGAPKGAGVQTPVDALERQRPSRWRPRRVPAKPAGLSRRAWCLLVLGNANNHSAQGRRASGLSCQDAPRKSAPTVSPARVRSPSPATAPACSQALLLFLPGVVVETAPDLLEVTGRTPNAHARLSGTCSPLVVHVVEDGQARTSRGVGRGGWGRRWPTDMMGGAARLIAPLRATIASCAEREGPPAPDTCPVKEGTRKEERGTSAQVRGD